MKKYFYSSIAGALVMTIVFIALAMADMKLFSAELYASFPLISYKGNYIGFIGLLFLVKLFHAFLLSYLHEKIPRCNSSLWQKAWRFTLLSFLVFYSVGFFMAGIMVQIPILILGPWAIHGFAQTFAASFVIIPILYKYPAPDLTCKIGK